MLSRLLSGDEGEVGPPGYEGIREKFNFLKTFVGIKSD